MKSFVFFWTALAAVAFSACGGDASNTREVKFDDAAHVVAADEVVISDADLKNNSLNASADMTANQNRTEPIKILADKSELETSYDAYGNKSETRYFKNRSRLKFVLVRTASDGEKQVFVYGYGNDTKLMPEDFSELALTRSAEEIAAAAGLKNRIGDTNKLNNFLKKSESAPPAVQMPLNSPTQTLPAATEPATTEPAPAAPAENRNPQSIPAEEKPPNAHDDPSIK